ncbi:hypothetical protein METP1_00354 [Methanosarcinales archaeon]|nr:hypothetical protein METP1_00354 [Methanosarcinales archaeon]
MVETEGIDPSQILAPTFSKETASNMREKVERLLQGKEVIVKTFHSFCVVLINERFQNFIRKIFVDNAITNLFAGIRRKESIDHIKNTD